MKLATANQAGIDAMMLSKESAFINEVYNPD
jgi:hypothetical protein